MQTVEEIEADLLEMGRERDARLKRARELLREQVRIHGVYRRRLRRRQLGVFHNDRIQLILRAQLYFSLFSANGFVTRVPKLARQFLTASTNILSAIENETGEIDRGQATKLFTEIQLMLQVLMDDFEAAKRKYVLPWMAENVGVIVIPDSAAVETRFHEDLHAEVSAAAIELMADGGLTTKKAYEIINQAFLNKLEEVEKSSARPDLHRTYREMVSPLYGTLTSHGYEEIFARAEAAILGNGGVVLDKDVALISSFGLEAPSNYEELIRYCLPEIAIHLMGKHFTAKQFIRDTLDELNIPRIHTYHR